MRVAQSGRLSMLNLPGKHVPADQLNTYQNVSIALLFVAVIAAGLGVLVTALLYSWRIRQRDEKHRKEIKRLLEKGEAFTDWEVVHSNALLRLLFILDFLLRELSLGERFESVGIHNGSIYPVQERNDGRKSVVTLGCWIRTNSGASAELRVYADAQRFAWVRIEHSLQADPVWDVFASIPVDDRTVDVPYDLVASAIDQETKEELEALLNMLYTENGQCPNPIT